MSREEIEAMLDLSELKPRFYQEAFREGKEEGERISKLKTVLLTLTAGLTVKQIAEDLDVIYR